ncbi:MAG: sarcosine oxidase subunit delta [Mesorhizobium sp.]|uniref:sarcosine oxidase subunit delta n=1 Tax=Mesorhizobium sp. TaxID=1871066 RepID=UPI0011F95504|nr:sarcosine oxidase subunit delta [Mesorhizobium sp.]TIS56613.1 MAG: sarcosine oxidase subunit delta [Mesorhizobium sp.]TIS89130.1 MAG: sarcosine oxidase subunit delta [Mesorhizobium sp.]TJW10966.1 MAG: sarcosine oxidase subunit delta [Mesorhizobium sp.]TJW41304.1 MAG: sarcosine oxidase subunit delta [Mesorhizobium sp.]
MLRIECPCCGLRDHDEFRYGGDASVTRPGHDDPDPEAWYRYVYVRANPAGLHREFWQHVIGCRQWLMVERDTRNHAIASVAFARKAPAKKSFTQTSLAQKSLTKKSPVRKSTA